MDPTTFDAVVRAVRAPGSRRRAVTAALGATLVAFARRDSAAKKKKGKGKGKPCPACATCPPPRDTCPQRICCECESPTTGDEIACTFVPAGSDDGLAACIAFCGGNQPSRTLPKPGTANMCTTAFQCVSVSCPVP